MYIKPFLASTMQVLCVSLAHNFDKFKQLAAWLCARCLHCKNKRFTLIQLRFYTSVAGLCMHT